MAKMYIFRKMSQLNRQQSDVCEEAITGVLDDVLNGKSSTIFNYGSWADSGSAGDRLTNMDMMERTLNKLFSHVYSMGVSMEINISISHIQRYVAQSESINAADDCERTLKEAREHFVASTNDVYRYMEKEMGPLMRSDRKMITNDKFPYALFTICVSQTNLEQSMQLQGNLQLIQLVTVNDRPEIWQLGTPMASLLRIMSALARNRKTHLRYYNIRLTRILKDLLGDDETTVIFNYTNESNTQLDTDATFGCAKIWKALYMQERNKFNALKRKIFGLELWTDTGHKLQLEDLLDMQQTSRGSCAHLELIVRDSRRQPDKLLCENQRELCIELSRIQADAQASFEEMMQIHHTIEQLTQHFEQSTQQLAQKNQMLDRQQIQLAEANNKLQKQRITFEHKFAAYSDMFRSLWEQQRATLQLQEEEREAQLSLMFDTVYNEMHGTQQTHRQLENVEVQRNYVKS